MDTYFKRLNAKITDLSALGAIIVQGIEDEDEDEDEGEDDDEDEDDENEDKDEDEDEDEGKKNGREINCGNKKAKKDKGKDGDEKNDLKGDGDDKNVKKAKKVRKSHRCWTALRDLWPAQGLDHDV